MPLGSRHHNELRTYESACVDENNLLLPLHYQRAAEDLQRLLWNQRDSIAALFRHHLGLGRDDTCAVLPPSSWIRGGFNICVLVEVTRWHASTQKLVFRCPMPHKLAEDAYPGTIDEKHSCEVASYVWMQEHCHSIRIPHLYAFGFTKGDHFTHIRQRPLYYRIYRRICRWIYGFLGLPLLSNYARNTSAPAVGTAYSILEYIDPTIGQMLSTTWTQHRNDCVRRTRLYRGLARIMLSLARIPQPSIGTYRFSTVDSTIRLINRPLMCSMIIMENCATPRTIHPEQTYQSVESFTSDMLTLHDNYLLHQPHAVRGADDAQERFAIRTLLRAVSHHFTERCQRSAPYILQLTDFHQSNIFVDEDWNVTAMIDLEWICSLPVEMLSVPYWLTDCSIDSIVNEQYDEFNSAREEFLATMDEEVEHANMRFEHDIAITRVMREAWLSKGVWFWACIRSINGWLFVFEDHILPKFSGDRKLVSRLKQISAFWKEDVESVIEAKVKDEEKYQEELRAILKGNAQD